MNKPLLILLLFIVSCTKQNKKSHENIDAVIFKENEIVRENNNNNNNVYGKVFYRVIYETKDSLVVGKFNSGKSNVISFLTKDSLFYANGIDGGFLKIDGIKKEINNSYEIDVISFDNNMKVKKKLNLKLINKDEGLWLIDKNGYDFYEANDGTTYIDKENLDSIKVIYTKKDVIDFPDAFNEESQNEYFFYKIKEKINRGEFITTLNKDAR